LCLIYSFARIRTFDIIYLNVFRSSKDFRSFLTVTVQGRTSFYLQPITPVSKERRYTLMLILTLSHYTKPSKTSEERKVPVALIHQGVNEVDITPDCIDKTFQDFKEFWGLWQIEVEDVFPEHYIRPSPALFCLNPEDSKRLAKNFFDSNVPQWDRQCVLLVLCLGTTSHDALEHLQACSVDLDVNIRPEVALLSNMGLEDRIKTALKGVKGQFFCQSSAGEALSFSGHKLSMEVMAEESTYARNHLESSLCLSAAQAYHGSLSIDSLLSRCGIPFSYTDDRKHLIKQKLRVTKRFLTCCSNSNSKSSSGSLDEKRFKDANLDERGLSNSLQMTILCGIHGSHMADVAGCIVSAATTNIVWSVLHPKSLTEVSELLISSLRDKKQREESGETRLFRCLLVAPLWISVPEILTHLEFHLRPTCDDPKAASICITSTITCVDLRMCLMGSDGLFSLILPGLCPLFDRGWVNMIIYTNPTKFGQIWTTHLYSLLCSHCSSLGVYRLETISVRFKLPLDKNKWVSALKGLRSNLSPFSEGPIVVYVEASLAFDEDPKSIISCRYWPQIDFLKETKDAFKVESGDTASKTVALYSLIAHFFITRRNVVMRSIYDGDCKEKLRNWLKAWLRECLREAEKLRPLIEKEKLTNDELDEIQECHFPFISIRL
uniref:Si:dkey-13n23.3 n=1 Tax=Hydatigena taeniaeformis TaxID=6205 RepID=A0A158RDD2_HYDTA